VGRRGKERVLEVKRTEVELMEYNRWSELVQSIQCAMEISG
jgi:hypothetical protein